ncbi:Mitotic spindle-associated MMXD complex subunit MIP18 [Thoreauomyces humboldtii]|nr:Mitotic spindle-associated MMXD complex subunit MIP18 [Thoreauomyces humboldtii]
MNDQLLNANPTVFDAGASNRAARPEDLDESITDPFDAQEIFDLIRHINDPEHPLTLEQLNVAQPELVTVDDQASQVLVRFTPTIPHCSMATLIGLCIRVRLLRSLPDRFKVDIRVSEGSHQSEHAVNKQLNDKERVAAALENTHLLEVVNQCLLTAVEKTV